MRVGGPNVTRRVKRQRVSGASLPRFERLGSPVARLFRRDCWIEFDPPDAVDQRPLHAHVDLAVTRAFVAEDRVDLDLARS